MAATRQRLVLQKSTFTKLVRKIAKQENLQFRNDPKAKFGYIAFMELHEATEGFLTEVLKRWHSGKRTKITIETD